MEPFEIMVSESQERMLCVVTPESVDEVLAVCEHWETRATVIGKVTDRAGLRVLDAGAVVADMPDRGARRRLPALRARPRPARAASCTHRPRPRSPPTAPDAILLGLLASPNIASTPAGLRAVRLHRPVAHGAPARARPMRPC